MSWCSGYYYYKTSFNKAWTQVLRSFKSCLRRVGDSRLWGSLTMVPAGDKAKRLSSVNHTTKTIHHHHLHHHLELAVISRNIRRASRLILFERDVKHERRMFFGFQGWDIHLRIKTCQLNIEIYISLKIYIACS